MIKNENLSSYYDEGKNMNIDIKKFLKKIKKTRIFGLIEILLFIAVCMGIGAGASYVNNQSDPTDKAVLYFRAFASRDYDKMYSFVEKDSEHYLDKNMYISQMKKLRDSMSIDSYDIEKVKNENGLKVVNFDCKKSDSNSIEKFVVKMTVKRGWFQIIPDYEINMESTMSKNVTITIPKGSNLELNGQVITEKNASIEEKNNLKEYTFDYILKGTYKIEGTTKYYAQVKSDYIKDDNIKIDLSKNSLTSSDSYKKKIDTFGTDLVKKFYTSVRNKNEKDVKLLKLCTTKSLQKKMKKLVSKSEDVIFWPDTRNIENYKVIQWKLSKLNNNIVYNKDHTYTVKYSYDYQYVSATDTALYTSYVYKISGRCNSVMTVVYSIKNDKLVLKDIQIKNKNRKK